VDDAALSPEERLTEVAAILASGLLRMKTAPPANVPVPPESAESSEKALEVCAPSRTHPPAG